MLLRNLPPDSLLFPLRQKELYISSKGAISSHTQKQLTKTPYLHTHVISCLQESEQEPQMKGSSSVEQEASLQAQ